MILNIIFTLTEAIPKSEIINKIIIKISKIINKSHHKFKNQNSQNTEIGTLPFIEIMQA